MGGGGWKKGHFVSGYQDFADSKKMKHGRLDAWAHNPGEVLTGLARRIESHV